MTTVLRLMALPFMVTLALDLQTPATQPSNTVAQRIVGTWQLMTRTVSRPDGTKIVDPVLGEKPTGRLVYDASGGMKSDVTIRLRSGRAEIPCGLKSCCGGSAGHSPIIRRPSSNSATRPGVPPA